MPYFGIKNALLLGRNFKRIILILEIDALEFV